MPNSEAVSIAYAAWTRAHHALLEAESVRDNLGQGASIVAREDAQRRVDAFRNVSDGLLELAQAVLARRESKPGVPKI